MAKSHVYVFSGLMSSIVPGFSKGTKEIAAQIKYEHPTLEVSHHIWNEWKNISDEIIKRSMKSGRHDVYIIGHSNGVLACANIAEDLRKMDIDVKYIGAIDPTAASFPEIGSNVTKVDEFWARTGWPAVKRRLTRNKRGACVFSKAFKGIKTLIKVPTTHVGASSSDRTVKQILTSIQELAGD